MKLIYLLIYLEMYINIDEHRLELALKSIKNEPLDLDNEIDFWLYHFNIEMEKLCQTYQIENVGYNFIFYLYYNNCNCYSNLDENCKKHTSSILYNSVSSFFNSQHDDSLKNNITTSNDQLLYDYLKDNLKIFVKCLQLIKHKEEILNLYNLKIKFTTPATRYVTVR